MTNKLKNMFSGRRKLADKIDKSINERVRKFISTVDNDLVKNTKRGDDLDNSLEILIPCYNHGNYLTDALSSIKLQTASCKNISVTLINDASTDNTLEVMSELIGSNSQIFKDLKIINNETNLLQFGSINRAVSESNNNLFMILNADDLLTPDCVQLTLDTYNRHKDIFLLGGLSIQFSGLKAMPKFVPVRHESLILTKYGPADAKMFNSPNSINISHSSSSFFKSAWSLVGGYFPLTKRVCSHDDRDFQMRVCSLLPIGIYEDYPMEFYRTDSSQKRGTV